MVCIYCGSKTEINNSRPQKRLNQVWRRRKCLQCGAIVSTTEAVNYNDVWRVQTHDNGLARLTHFETHKLFISLYKAVEHREHAVSDAGSLLDTIISLLRQQTDHGLLEAEQIAVAVHGVLERFDTAAAVYYAARHTL